MNIIHTAAVCLAVFGLVVAAGCQPGQPRGPGLGQNSAGNAVGLTYPANTGQGETSNVGHGSAGSPSLQGTGSRSTAPMQPALMPLSRFAWSGIKGVSFVDGHTGFVVGHDGILRSQDGGETWAEVYRAADPVLGVSAPRVATNEAAAGHVNVWAYTAHYLLASTDGRYFTRVNVPDLGQGVISSLSALPDAVVWVAAGGAVYVSNPFNGELQRRSPGGAHITQVSALSDEVAYASDGTSVWQTRDAGRHWVRVFQAPLRQEANAGTWQSRLQAAGQDVWVMFYGGGAGMSQQAYVIYHSADGAHFTPVAYEGYFQSLYPDVHLPAQANIGAQPGPMAALGSGRALWVGWVPRGAGDSLQFTTTADGGRTLQSQTLLTTAASAPDFFSGLDVSFVDPAHGWLVGTNRAKQAVVLRTMDGGRTWLPVS
ncbi:MAG: hypothetical protein K6T31_04355 [Alicyclobacillus sp.]|nr:hypothetical protein [Alicyclobacillus sp.]